MLVDHLVQEIHIFANKIGGLHGREGNAVFLGIMPAQSALPGPLKAHSLQSLAAFLQGLAVHPKGKGQGSVHIQALTLGKTPDAAHHMFVQSLIPGMAFQVFKFRFLQNGLGNNAHDAAEFPLPLAFRQLAERCSSSWGTS